MAASYRRQWWVRAWRDFRTSPSVSGMSAALAAILIAALILLWLQPFGDEARDIWLSSAITVGALVAPYLWVFLWHFFHAPGRIAAEGQGAHEAQVAELERETTRARDEAQRLTQAYELRPRSNAALAQDLDHTADQIIEQWNGMSLMRDAPNPAFEMGDEARRDSERIIMTMRTDFASDAQRTMEVRYGGKVRALSDECVLAEVWTRDDGPYMRGPTGVHFPEIAHRFKGLAIRLRQVDEEAGESPPA